MPNQAVFVVAAITAILSGVEPGISAGAIAVGRPSDIAKQGISMGFVTSYATVNEAKTAALARCKTNGSDQSKALCQVVATFSNLCAAEAFDPQTGTPGFGWAIADTTQAATDQAMSNCRDTAGPSRQNACQITGKVLCDGSAK